MSPVDPRAASETRRAARRTAVDPRWFALFAVGNTRSAPRGRPRSRQSPRKCSVSSVTPTKRTGSDRSTRNDRTSVNKLLRAQFRAVSRRKHLQIIGRAPSHGTEASSDSHHICDDFVAGVPEVWSWNRLGARVLGKVAQGVRAVRFPAPTLRKRFSSRSAHRRGPARCPRSKILFPRPSRRSIAASHPVAWTRAANFVDRRCSAPPAPFCANKASSAPPDAGCGGPLGGVRARRRRRRAPRCCQIGRFCVKNEFFA